LLQYRDIWCGDIVGNNIENNSSVFLVWMH